MYTNHRESMHTMDGTEMWKNSSYKLSIMDILLIGEQLRIQMHTATPSLIRERNHFLYKYSCCFVGREAVDWLLTHGGVSSRYQAVRLMRLLQNNHIIQPVTSNNDFQDSNRLFRFTKDTGTFPWNDDVALFLKAQRLFNKLLKARKSPIRTVYHEGTLHRHSFYGNEMVTWLLSSREAKTRDMAVSICRKMLENDIIRHVSDRYHFRDELLLYEFKCDFTQKKTLKDLLSPEQRRESVQSNQQNGSMSQNIPINMNNSRYKLLGNLTRMSTQNSKTGSLNSTSSYFSDEGIVSDSDLCLASSSSPVQFPRASVEELEKTNNFVKKHVRIMSDPVGYGFVIRGDAPVHVQTVDPSGPAALAGLKVGQFIHSVNDKINVLRMSHKDLAKVILASDGYVDLVVMEPQSEAQSDSEMTLQ